MTATYLRNVDLPAMFGPARPQLDPESRHVRASLNTLRDDASLRHRPVRREGGVPLTFQDRTGAFEAKYPHDQDFRLRSKARRDKLFARWLFAKLHRLTQEADRLHHAVLAVADGPNQSDELLTMASKALLENYGGMSATVPEAGPSAYVVQAWEELPGFPPHLAVKGHI